MARYRSGSYLVGDWVGWDVVGGRGGGGVSWGGELGDIWTSLGGNCGVWTLGLSCGSLMSAGGSCGTEFDEAADGNAPPAPEFAPPPPSSSSP
mmetsp:Transcript_30460/g.56255  ORF Transcript_30460/g.56255 Transcript_30460/m.56255 type:complete len:93 (+) Transcript_30460:81-359(+)